LHADAAGFLFVSRNCQNEVGIDAIPYASDNHYHPGFDFRFYANSYVYNNSHDDLCTCFHAKDD
jgi:hypothetical protein